MSFMDFLGGGDDASQEYLKQALSQYNTVKTPTVADETVGNLPEETVQGTVTPEQIAAVDQAGSAYNNINLDPASRQAQMNALAGYQDIANSGGLDANAKLGIQQVIDATNRQSQGAQGAIQQQAQAMGQGGGDFALTQRAIAAQGASNNAATQGLQQAAEAEANREAALTQLSNIGGSINASDFGQAATKAQAQNQINATNQGYQNQANVGNVANNMIAQQGNVANAQGVNAANTAAKQNQVYYNANLPQQQFNNELAKANGMAGVNSQQAGAAQVASNNQAAMSGKLIGAGGQIAGAYMGGGMGGGSSPSASSASIGGGRSTPTGANADPSNYGMADGGVVCYASGGVSMPHDHTICMKMGGATERADLRNGGYMAARTPEEKATVAGDSERNDKIPADLSEDELVIPRSVPKDGPHMEEFARKAPVNGNPEKRVDLGSFTKGYRRGR